MNPRTFACLALLWLCVLAPTALAQSLPALREFYFDDDHAARPIRIVEGTDDAAVEQLVWKQLRTCFDPEIPINVVDLGLVYEAVVHPPVDGNRTVEVKMTLTAPGCGMGDILVDDVRSKLEMIPTISEADVELVFDPPWNRSMMSEAARPETGMY